jgi:hypothetical protein
MLLIILFLHIAHGYVCPEDCDFNGFTCEHVKHKSFYLWCNPRLEYNAEPYGCELNTTSGKYTNRILEPWHKLLTPYDVENNRYNIVCCDENSTINCTSIRENLIEASCGYGYKFIESFSYCHENNLDSICKIDERKIRYKKNSSASEYTCDYSFMSKKIEQHLINDTYFEHLCKYQYEMDCERMNGAIVCCPRNCERDVQHNKCKPSYEDIVCGALQLTEPVSNNNILTCNKELIMFNITSINGTNYTVCGPDWYYDRNGMTFKSRDKPKNDSNAQGFIYIILWTLLFIFFHKK